MINTEKFFDVAVIGSGIFGSEIAIELKKAGLSVALLESKKDILLGASQNNQNRLHLGFHYPRDLETGKQCIDGFYAFKKKYTECINEQFKNYYLISSENSNVSSDQFIDHAKALNVPFKEINIDQLPIEMTNIKSGLSCEEVVYDCSILRELVRSSLKSNAVELSLNWEVSEINKKLDIYKIFSNSGDMINAKSLINCTYADINNLTKKLGFDVHMNQYEYTVVPIISLDIDKLGLTVMDGPFMTLLPYGKSDHFLLYHVENSVIAKENSYFINSDWLTKKTSPFKKIDKEIFFQSFINKCSSHMPFLKDARLIGYLEGPRMVLTNKDDTDARPSIINKYDENYITVFSGKIDHSIWVAEDIKNHLISIIR